MSASTTISPQDTKTYNVDRKLTTSTGSILNISDAPLSAANGGSINITTSDADVAKAALDTAGKLTNASNAIAAGVADSQRAFVETASGQKTWVYGAMIAAVVAIFFFYFRKKV
jgi:hypothetical protein